jgi:hypothetical protein
VIATLALFVCLSPQDAPAAKKLADEPGPKIREGQPEIGVAEIAGSVRKGAVLLLARQESLSPPPEDAEAASKSPKGAVEPGREWPYEGVYRVDGDIPIGYRVGGTAICATALLEARGDDLPGATAEAVDRGLAFVLEGIRDPRMSPGFEGGYDTRGWGHAYALGFLLRLRELGRVPAGVKPRVDEAVGWLVEALQKTEIRSRGGWNYARGKDPDSAAPSSFMTAPTLQFLFEAAHQGEKVDSEVVGRALAALESGRLETGAFQYGIDPARRTGKGFEAVEGAIGRSPICETTLYLAGRGSVERIRGALDAFFAHWEWLEKRRKQTGTHAPPFMIAPYYFFYAHRYAAQAIELLPSADRPGYRQELYRLLWSVREEDGGWNDRVFPRSESFGTAMTMLALLAPKLPAPARWTEKK